MKSLKTILGICLASASFGGVLVAGAAILNDNVFESAEAATTVTVYYAVSTSYTVKCNMKNGNQDGGQWSTYTMSKNGKKRGGLDIYSCSFSKNDSGLVTMQFQQYDGSTWKSEVVPFSDTWVTFDVYNGKLYYDSTWNAYAYDVKITKYPVVDGIAESSSGNETILSNTSYNVPSRPFREGYSCSGWYTDQACTQPFNAARTFTADQNLYIKYTSGTWSGTVTVDLRDSGWANSSANYAIYFWNNTYSTEVKGWSNYLTGTTSGKRLISFSYSFNFDPTHLSVVRYPTSNSASDWNKDKWANKDKQTIDTSFSEMVVIRSTETDSKKNTNIGYARILGGTSGQAWSELASLNTLKLNDSNYVKYYATTVSLTSGQSFKVVDADNTYYNTYSTLSSISSNFTHTGQNNDIYVNTSGTYGLYFDSDTHSLYITTTAQATADEWAQSFLAGMVCNGSSITTDNWTTLSTSYTEELSSDAKALFLAVPEDGNKTGTFIEQAIARYDFIIKKYKTTAKPDFMGRIEAGKLHVNANYMNPIIKSDSSLIIVMASLSISLMAFGTLVFLKKKGKEN